MTPRHDCADCGIDTSHRDGIGEMYMVHPELWFTATAGQMRIMLCVGCLEGRIGRRLAFEDFTFAPINWTDVLGAKSERLAARLRVVAAA